MTKEDVKKVVDALKESDMGVIDLINPTYNSVANETGMKVVSLNIYNTLAVIGRVCVELNIE